MKHLLAFGALALGFCVTAPAFAQDPYGGGLQPGFGGGGPPPAQPQPKAPPPGTPEQHAASGGESLLPPGTEPSLPANPLRLKKSVKKRIGTDYFPDDEESGREAAGFGSEGETERSFYGLYYKERSNKYQLTTVFPFWFERKKLSLTDPTKVDRASLFGGLYYNRRSAEHADDVLFPIFWNLRDKDSRTTVVGPWVNRQAPGETDNWFAPIYFTGTRPDGGYTIIPPLLTYLNHDAHGGFNLLGPAFCSWEGGPSCDPRTAKDLDLGIAPFYFYGQNEQTKYEVIPPLLHYYRYNDRDLSWLNVWGPYYRKHTQERDYFHLLPLYWHIWGQDESHTTLFPFYHYGRKGPRERLFINPLWLDATGENGEKTFVTWGYARYRGRTSLDMITPLFWQYSDPDIGLDQTLLFPFYYRRTSPRENSLALFPFYGSFNTYGISRTTWITPFFQHTSSLTGWETNIHPFVYLGRNGNSSHTVVAPFFWDFASPGSRATVGFPLYWRFSNREEVNQLVGNVYYREKKLGTGLDWEFHIFPLFSYGETPDGHWWNVLYGLAGYTRRGETTKMRTFWIPITLSEPAKAIHGERF
ncbi:MAG: hypothetical protein H6718_15270 [Polyangiaceae bacterium]|nr:hypothetical protein [Polyangiaceae bacterium]MCB9606267.1 hypothetical protein [Polyangiaceae bacterium]